MSDPNAADRAAIADILARYCRHLDDERYDSIAELFALDAVFETMGQELHDRAGIRSFFPEDIGGLDRPRGMHVLSSPIIDLEGDCASAESDWMLVRRNGEGACVIVSAGRYRDRFRRVDGTWKIAHRQAISLARTPIEGTE
jgi:3-phenylpropionate/cinnamic acid dioxygenase small subunit